MELLIIRHGDPDYTIDSLTEKGWKEAEYLSEKLVKMDIQDFYVSPLGRARDTASCTLKKLNREAVVCPWLREFSPRINRPDVTGCLRTGRRIRNFMTMITGGRHRYFRRKMLKLSMTG